MRSACPECGAARFDVLWCGQCGHIETEVQPDLSEPRAWLREEGGYRQRPMSRWRATPTTFGLPVKVAVTLLVLLAGRFMWVMAAMANITPAAYLGLVAYLALAIPLLRSLWRRVPIDPRR